MEYKTEIPTPEDLKILEEIKKYKFIYAVLKEEPQYILNKIDKVLKAFYS